MNYIALFIRHGIPKSRLVPSDLEMETRSAGWVYTLWVSKYNGGIVKHLPISFYLCLIELHQLQGLPYFCYQSLF